MGEAYLAPRALQLRSVRCRCDAPIDRWRVLDRNCNYSRFNGGRHTPSDYSAVKCMSCGWVWRTKANYVGELPDATPAERLK